MGYIDKIKIHNVDFDIKGQVDPDDITAVTYDKTEINNLLNDKVSTGQVYSKTEMDNYLDGFYDKQEMDIKLDEKLDASAYTPSDLSNYYTKAQSDNKYQEKGNYVSANTLNNYYTKSEVDGELQGQVHLITEQTNEKLASKANSSDVYKKTETSGKTEIANALSSKANSSDVYTKTESDAKYLTQHQDLSAYAQKSFVEASLTAYTYDKATIDEKVAQGGSFDPTAYYNKTQTDALLQGKANTATTYTKSEVDEKLASKADKPDDPDDSYATERWVAQSFVEQPVMEQYYSKTESDAKYITQVKTINNQVITGTGNINITADITVDSALSTASTNPVQNGVITNKINDVEGLAETNESKINALEPKVDALEVATGNVYTKNEVNNLLQGKASSAHTHTVANITDFPTKLVSGATRAYTIQVLSQAEWEAITTPDNNVIYLIKE